MASAGGLSGVLITVHLVHGEGHCVAAACLRVPIRLALIVATDPAASIGAGVGLSVLHGVGRDGTKGLRA